MCRPLPDRRLLILITFVCEQSVLQLLYFLLEFQILLPKLADLVGLLDRTVIVAFADEELAFSGMAGRTTGLTWFGAVALSQVSYAANKLSSVDQP